MYSYRKSSSKSGSGSGSGSGSRSGSRKKRKLWKFYVNNKRTYNWLIKEFGDDKNIKTEIDKYKEDEWRKLLLKVLLPESDNSIFQKYKKKFIVPILSYDNKYKNGDVVYIENFSMTNYRKYHDLFFIHKKGNTVNLKPIEEGMIQLYNMYYKYDYSNVNKNIKKL